MDVKLHEIKKIITTPIIIVLTSIFILFNVLTIFNNNFIKSDLKIINDLIGEFGHEINDTMLSEMKYESEKNLKKLNSITTEKFNKTYETIDHFINSDEYYYKIDEKGYFSKEEKDFFNKVNLLDVYANISMDYVRNYENLDITQIGENSIKSAGVSGEAANIARENYKKLSTRFEELKENKEHKNLFFLGKPYETHSSLFGNIFSKCIYEIIILVVLISTYLINYEFDNKTSLLVYSTKRGRKNAKDKLFVCLISSLVISIIILGITLLTYFMQFNYSNVWNVSISNAFNWEYLVPYISWFNFSFLQYLLLSILVVLICAPIFSAITFIISKTVKNSYIVFFVFFIIFGLSMILPTLVGTSSALSMYLYYDVFNLILFSGKWFMEKGPFILNKYHEVVTLSAWTIIVCMGSKYTMNKFEKQDIS